MKRIFMLGTVTLMFLFGCEEVTFDDLDLQDISIEEVDADAEVKDAKDESLNIVEEVEIDTEIDKIAEAQNNDKKFHFDAVDEDDYIDMVNDILTIQTGTIRNVGDLVGDAKANISLTQNEEHLNSLELAYVNLETTLDIMNQMSEEGIVPEMFENSHEYLTKSVYEFIATKPYFIEGLIKIDDDIISEGLKRMEISEEYFNKFNEEFTEIMSIHR